MAGFADERPEAVAAAQPGDSTLAGLRLAQDVQRNVQYKADGMRP
ncbi:NADH-quinone oxidoreductase subunit E [Mycobacteroides abscessus subsp. abscessus]|nr:NADH-quinone oxidoreductase subunit E [Mycobacteroides abscessus subsp. abscessus]